MKDFVERGVRFLFNHRKRKIVRIGRDGSAQLASRMARRRSSPTRVAAILSLLAAMALLPAGALAQGFPPDEAAGRMTVAPGFRVELVAAEPLVRQPVAIEFDDRGRLWVIQYLQYPNPAGLKRVEVDRYSRTEYDRVPEPPPHGSIGADRITILEDTDGDGLADRAKDFVDGLNLASGLAFGHGGVFVLNVPYLLFYPDQDRDDVPDSDPEVLLTGFGMQDAHSVANSLTWGPDGWLYGTQGSTVTANIRGIEFQQGVWRYHPRTREFELFCEGGGNSWGLDFDASGRTLYSTNHGGYVMLDGVQGGYFWKQFSKHGALHNPYAFGFFDHVPHENFQGGHVTVGGVVYRGTSFSPEWRGRYIAADLLGHAVHWHEISPDGSSIRTRHGGTLLAANDTWFAPSDVTIGPDGAVYVADWHDPRTAHPDPDATWDRTNGRIYRIQAVDAPTHAPVTDAREVASDKLIEWLASEDDWRVRRARRVLMERRDESTWRRLRDLAEQEESPQLAAEALWALYSSGGFDDAVAEALLDHRSATVRAWTVRLLADERKLAPGLLRSIVKLARRESDPAVRRQLAASSRRLPFDQTLQLAESLWVHDQDADDPHIPLLLWWALESHAAENRTTLVERFMQRDVWDEPLARRWLVPRLVRRIAAQRDDAGLDACGRLVEAAPPGEPRDMLLGVLDEALRGRRFDAAPASFQDVLAQQLERRPDDPVLARLAMRVGMDGARELALSKIADREAPEADRIALVEVIAETRAGDDWKPLFALVDTAEPEAVRAAALGALGAFADEAIAPAVLDVYESLSESLRRRAHDLLLSRRTWARTLLERVDAGQLAPDAIPVERLRGLAAFEDKQLDALVRKHWGNVTGGTPGERLAEVRRLNNDLRAASGDAARGRELFEKHCAACHQLFGRGTALGPDLTHANRQDLDYLLASLVDPGNYVRTEYINWIAAMEDGRILSGLIVDETPSTVTLADAKNERMALSRERIEELRPAANSLMPDDLYRQLDPQQLRDLIGYLQSDSAVNTE